MSNRTPAQHFARVAFLRAVREARPGAFEQLHELGWTPNCIEPWIHHELELVPVDWLVTSARQLARWWAEHPDTRGTISVPWEGRRSPTVTLEVGAWNAIQAGRTPLGGGEPHETRDQARARMEREAAEQIQKYLDAQQPAGNAQPQELQRNLRWLVRHIYGASWGELARDYLVDQGGPEPDPDEVKRSRSSIKKPVTRIASFIDYPLPHRR